MDVQISNAAYQQKKEMAFGSPVFQKLDEEALNHIKSQSLLSDIFSLREQTTEVRLSLFKKCLLICREWEVCSCHLFSFESKFQIIYEEENQVLSTKIGIRLINQNQKSLDLFSGEPLLIEKWTHYLSQIINQRGFHQMFKPLKKLGKGNFASVYEVQRNTDGKHFAVKAFSKATTYSTKHGKDSLISQLQIMRSLSHPNTLKLDCVYESVNSVYVILELVTGGQLFHRIQESKGVFKEQEIKRFLYQLLAGLAHMHQRRIMHRDLKPENIMIRDEHSFLPVIADFGLSSHCDISPYLFYRCGTPGYVAPEIICLENDQHIEPECDIFSAGVIMHILLVRKPLFEGAIYNQVYKRNKQMSFDLTGSRYSNLSSVSLDLLKQMLVQDPRRRIKAKQAMRHQYFREFHLQLRKGNEAV